MHNGKEIIVEPFSSALNPLLNISLPQAAYLRSYLIGLKVETVLIEQNYFDRDYLDEFSVFYSKSARGYPNICQRVHFFTTSFNKQILKNALCEDEAAKKVLQDNYIGFTVIRPISLSPLGRTVVAWYPQPSDGTFRVVTPSREYIATIGGLQLRVNGLAWQQQDTGVSACATIGIWTMLHSSAFDDHHSIPTTASITQAAHEKASLGDRIFPSKGLKNYQILEAIKAQNLTPIVSAGDLPSKGPFPLFSLSKFSSTCSAFIRSGYPVLLIGHYLKPVSNCGHMVCVVGFKESGDYAVNPGNFKPMDGNTEVFYVHDDNIGPNVRCRLSAINIDGQEAAQLTTIPPDYVDDGIKEPKQEFVFIPGQIIVAVHEELRIGADDFYNAALHRIAKVSHLLNVAYINSGAIPPKLLFSSRFLTIKDYLAEELPRLCDEMRDILGKVRLELMEKAPPISLHIGIIRIAILNDDLELVTDIICDTTDSDRNQPIFAHIVFNDALTNMLAKVPTKEVEAFFGEQIIAHN